MSLDEELRERVSKQGTLILYLKINWESRRVALSQHSSEFINNYLFEQQ